MTGRETTPPDECALTRSGLPHGPHTFGPMDAVRLPYECPGLADAGRKATWTIEAKGFDCPLCFHGVEMHDGESCTAPEGYDHLNGFHECGCPLTPPARETT